MPRGLTVYSTLEGHWGWQCDRCGAECRYVYRSRTKAARLASVHKQHCRGRRLVRGARS